MSTLIAMIDCGNFYRTLDTDVGAGACLVLGTSLPETHWTKLMTKKTAKRTQVVEHLTANTQVLELATHYAAIQRRIVDAKVESLLFEQSLIDAEGLDVDAFGTGPSLPGELTTDFTDFTLDGLWEMPDLDD